ncbi:MAG: GNAT family N-acetyltransferase [Hyphomicrobiaceae bacterium]|nr:GNAT family N-acetyltransferase [Hyphomicrobiaceae bacterium]
MASEPPVLRPAMPDDAEAVATVLRRSQRSLGFLPELHTDAEDLDFVSSVMFPDCSVVVAEVEGEVIGFSAWSRGWLDHLYLLPEWTGRGMGAALLGRVKADQDRLDLWTFQANSGARRFYERHGFVAVEFTDGAGNQEKLRDVRYRWTRRG